MALFYIVIFLMHILTYLIMVSGLFNTLTGYFEYGSVFAPVLLWVWSLLSYFFSVSLSSRSAPPPALRCAFSLHPVPVEPGYVQLVRLLFHPATAKRKTVMYSQHRLRSVSLSICLLDQYL